MPRLRTRAAGGGGSPGCAPSRHARDHQPYLPARRGAAEWLACRVHAIAPAPGRSLRQSPKPPVRVPRVGRGWVLREPPVLATRPAGCPPRPRWGRHCRMGGLPEAQGSAPARARPARPPPLTRAALSLSSSSGYPWRPSARRPSRVAAVTGAAPADGIHHPGSPRWHRPGRRGGRGAHRGNPARSPAP